MCARSLASSFSLLSLALPSLSLSASIPPSYRYLVQKTWSPGGLLFFSLVVLSSILCTGERINIPGQNLNLRFYLNEIQCVPDGDYIDEIHERWFGELQRPCTPACQSLMSMCFHVPVVHSDILCHRHQALTVAGDSRRGLSHPGGASRLCPVV